MLALSSLLLAALIPGGPIENRDFSHIHAGVLGVFNLSLTILNLGTIVVFYYVYKQRRWAISAAFIIAVAYFVVYAIDLAQLFPRSPTPMTSHLAMVEVLGMCAAILLMFLCLQYRPLFAIKPPIKQPSTSRNDIQQFALAKRRSMPVIRIALIVLLVGAGVGIVIFATDAAINSASAETAISHELDLPTVCPKTRGN
jgi:hypothetical protein